MAIPEDMQGRSLVPLLRGSPPADWRQTHYYHYYEHLIDQPTPHQVRRHDGVRTQRYKLINYYQLGEYELFDLQTDPRELSNVVLDPAYSEAAAQLKRELVRLRQELQVPDPGSAEAIEAARS